MERSYPVVGFLEDLTITLKVLERALPRFFSGVGKLYSEEMNSKKVVYWISIFFNNFVCSASHQQQRSQTEALQQGKGAASHKPHCGI